MRKFPSIEQYRNAIRNVIHRATYTGRDESGEPTFDPTRPKPVVKYRGTVKLHGTNAGIVFDIDSGTFKYQSRERELTLTSDNATFCLNMMAKEEVMRDLIETRVVQHCAGATEIVVFGEWCGQGIQKGVAISEVPKMFVIIGVKAFYAVEHPESSDPNEEEFAVWLDLADLKDFHSPEDRIFNIINFPHWEIDIDFARPELTQNRLVEITNMIEACCPVGKAFGVEGTGEGAVWQPVDPFFRKSANWFKVKGEKHSVSKVKTTNLVDVEAVKTIYEFVDRTVTEARLEQGLHWLQTEAQKPFEMTSMGDFIRWVFNDVVKEETDTLVASGIDPKKLGGPVANKARPWFIEKFNSKDLAA